MSQNKIFKRLLLVVAITLSSKGFSQTIGPWNLDKLYAVPSWEETTLAPISGMTSILYKSIDYLGNPVKVFAYYSAPSGTMPVGGWPAVVYVHGGGGTASSSWVKSLNQHGYAAISMDLEGHYPIKDSSGKYYSSPNPGPSRNGTWNDWQLDIKEQWYYHAVSQIILAHSLLS
ncbi:alpha/beta hydrolase family protein, partial [Arcticibacter svalbardensis]|uniref:hypothetical protein n=1 Tax=Arcticibacter svalbardensis TaxID=1288027 RepID=UPI00058AE6EB